MNENLIAQPVLAYNWAVVLYFFLGGLSAGCFAVAVVANYWKDELKPLAKTAALAAPISLAVGLLVLLLDLGRPLGGFALLVRFNPTSAVSWGTLFLGIFLVLSGVFAWFVSQGQDSKARIIGHVGLAFALLVATYTAVLLGQSPGRALWNSALLPVVFLAGGLVSGLALVILICSARGMSDVTAPLGKYVAGLLSLELGLVALELVALFNGDAGAVETGRLLLSGHYSIAFWGLQIALGAVVPIAILTRKSVPQAAQVVASVLVLVGVFTMRYIVVMGGQVIG
ncbi:MAG: NrfD/PsrC family molybdoenzyme membrane anchor subunit [Planctomycetota bacterium]|jgi:formate-dependent nitrite reductase membrane component NrfD